MMTVFEMVKEGKQCWIGNRPPYDMCAIDLQNCKNFRVSPKLHQSFDVVWYYENRFEELGTLSWKLALDEMIRLLKESGKLVIRIGMDRNPSIVELKSFLHRHMSIDASLMYEETNERERVYTVAFGIKRKNISIYSDSSWTLGILTTGNKVDSVVRFLDSVRTGCGNEKCEILIAGPQHEKYDAYNVKYVNCDGIRPEMAEISKKKNRILQEATAENVMILHDRYYLTPSFFEGFDQYGYDFDFLTVTQLNEEGLEFPGYAATYFGIQGGMSFKVEDLSHLYDGSYINGGLMIFKREIARQVRYNDMLLWQQMEDVELSKEMMERSIVPRVNFLSVAVALPTRADHFFYHGCLEKDVDPALLERRVGLEEAARRELHGKIDAAGISVRQFLIYGAGKKAEQLFSYMKEESRSRIAAVIVEDTTKNPEKFHGIPVVDYRKYIDSTYKIMIALQEKDQDGIEKQLVDAGVDKGRIVRLSEKELRLLYDAYAKKETK